MHKYIEERAIEIANYTIANKSTVRRTAKHFGVCKSTAHRDLTFVLPQVNPSLARQVYAILAENFDAKYVRGGEATKHKYKV